MIDVQQIIPLPEAQEYQIKLREKEQQERKNKAERHIERLKFWAGLIAIAKGKKTRHANLKPSEDSWIGASSGFRGLNFNYVIAQESGRVELYVDRGEKQQNKEIFDTLVAKKDEIEKAFGQALSWERLDDKRACRIKAMVITGGYRNPESDWPKIQTEMVETMIRLESALKGPIESLKL